MSALPTIEFGKRSLPIILQTQAAECGLACLAMIASYHGFRTDLPSLRARFNLSLKGCTLAQITDYADQLNMSSRAVRVDLDEVSELQRPCLLHWEMNHFVVLRDVTSTGVVVHDPTVGLRTLSFGKMSELFTGVALELLPTTDFVPVDELRRVSLTRLFGRVTGLWRGLSLVFVMALALEILALLGPTLNQWVVDEALVSQDRPLLNLVAVGMFLLMLIQFTLSQARGWTLMYLSTNLNLQWVNNVFCHMLRLDLSWFEKRHLGDIVSRFGSIGAIQRTLTTGFIAGALDGLMATTTLIMMLLYSAKLTVIVLLTVIAYAVLRTIAYRPFREANLEAISLSAKEQSHFLETIRAIQAIKLFGNERNRQARWLNLMVDCMNRGVRTQKLALAFGTANMAVTGVANLAVFWLGASLVMDGVFTIGMLFAFMSYSAMFGSHMGSLVDSFVEFKMLSIHSERLADIVLEPAESFTLDNSSVQGLTPRIELINVGFRYSDNEPWVLRGVNLVVEPGDSVAITGASGCGKTTLAKLVLNILVPTEGEIRYGGTPIKQLGALAYRSMLGAVTQSDQLLAGSLSENITFFAPHPDQGRMRESAQLAAIHDDIMAMPMAYETLTGDMGTTLSGGQKQRLLLARSLYKQPKVLVLDEATSHLDVALERQVNSAISALNITRIIIAHRPETIASARRVLAVVDGTVAPFEDIVNFAPT